LQKLYDVLQKTFKQNFKPNTELKNYTTFKIGGAADYFVDILSLKQLKRAIKICQRHKIEYRILGNGSNLLIDSAGIKNSVVLCLKKLNKIKIRHRIITAQAGAYLSQIIGCAARSGLSGLENLTGIPATLGGALVMNAGAYGTEIGQFVKKVWVLSNTPPLKRRPSTLEENFCSGVCRCLKVQKLKVRKLFFNYRNSTFKNLKNCVIIKAQLKLKPSDTKLVQQNIAQALKRRMQTQKVGYPSAGSTFMREGDILPAKIIDELGLKGLRAGGAEVSRIHSGYIVNISQATSGDILELIAKIKQRIKAECGIELKEEIICWSDK